MQQREKVTFPPSRVTSEGDILARARLPFGEDVTLSPGDIAEGDIGAGDSDMSARASISPSPCGAAFGRTSVAELSVGELIRIAAERVLDNVKAGRIYDPLTVQWARDMVAFNTRPGARS